jgi:hypothetical protein
MRRESLVVSRTARGLAMKSCRTVLALGVVAVLSYGLGAAAPEDESHPVVRGAREKFEQQVAAAVAPVRGRYLSELKTLKTKLTRENDLKGVESVDAELARLDEVERLWERHVLQGLWEVKYSNGNTRTYRISNTGSVQFVEGGLTGRIYSTRGDHVLEFGDGKIERLTLQPTLKIEHFNPKATYPLGAPNTTGTGVPTRR